MSYEASTTLRVNPARSVGSSHVVVPVFGAYNIRDAYTALTRSVTCCANKDGFTSAPGVKDVIFNNPATIVFWDDGTKTVVKCQDGDAYDKETGLAMAFAKKLFGNNGRFNDEFHKWIKD